MSKRLGDCAYCNKPVFSSQRHVDHREPSKGYNLGEPDDRLWHWLCYAKDLGIDQDVIEEQAEEYRERQAQLNFYEEE